MQSSKYMQKFISLVFRNRYNPTCLDHIFPGESVEQELFYRESIFTEPRVLGKISESLIPRGVRTRLVHGVVATG